MWSNGPATCGGTRPASLTVISSGSSSSNSVSWNWSRARRASRTLRAHCDPMPRGAGISTVSSWIVGWTGVKYVVPDLRPTCSRVAISAFALPGMPCSMSHGLTVSFIFSRSHGNWSAAGFRSSTSTRSAANPIAAPVAIHRIVLNIARPPVLGSMLRPRPATAKCRTADPFRRAGRRRTPGWSADPGWSAPRTAGRSARLSTWPITDATRGNDATARVTRPSTDGVRR